MNEVEIAKEILRNAVETIYESKTERFLPEEKVNERALCYKLSFICS